MNKLKWLCGTDTWRRQLLWTLISIAIVLKNTWVGCGDGRSLQQTCNESTYGKEVEQQARLWKNMKPRYTVFSVCL